MFQYLRNPSVSQLDMVRGNWFCLKGATKADLAIMDGVSGRQLHQFTVQHYLLALEGTAMPASVAWDWAGGGRGGATQIYVPPMLGGHIRATGPKVSW